MKASLGQLRAFQAVARELHFGRAAAALGIAQPTVSKEIRHLESAIGTPLLIRSAGGSRLTSAGEHLLPLAERVLKAMNAFDAAAAPARRLGRGLVTVAASPSIVNRLLPELLRSLDDAAADVDVVPLEVETGEVVAAVESGRADVGIGHLVGQTSRLLKRQLDEDELFVLVHQSWAARVTGETGLQALAPLPLLLWPRERSPLYYDFIIETCSARGLDPMVLTGTSRISGSWSYFLEDARAFSLVPKDYALREGQGEISAVPLSPPASLPLEVVWAKTPSPGRDRVLQELNRVTSGRRTQG